ncbi:MAG: MFS transporter [Clostridia bacterium]|nr:MFS transporter [Clostridia bacterium]
MATLILTIIFIDFIGLGIPDSLFGPAWPAIYAEFGLPVSLGSCVSLLNTAGTVISSLCSARLIKKFGTARVTAFSTVLTAIALLGFSFSGNFIFLCLFSLPLGLGGGAIDSALNNYVALHYKATHMNFLHCFYGIGVTVSPYFMSLALSHSNDWRGGYRLAFFVQIAIAFITLISIPLWKKADRKYASDEEQTEQKTISLIYLVKRRKVRLTWAAFICSCAIECTAGIWGSTFLVESMGMSEENAAKTIMFYYMGMAFGRFLSGVLASNLSSWKIIYLGCGVLALSLFMLFLSLGPVMTAFALFFVGVGNGPIFPNLTHLTPQNFGKDISQSVMGSQMAAAYIGIMVFPPFYGIVAQNITPDVFPYYISIFFVIMAISVALLRREVKRSM